MSVVELAREGLNLSCIDCGDRPFGGGLRCLSCFQKRCEDRASKLRHDCVRHTPGPSCYQMCKCRCEECKAGKRAYWKRS